GDRPSGQWDESPVRCLAEPLAGGGLDGATGLEARPRGLARGIADEDAAVRQHRVDRRGIERPREIEALGVLAAERPKAAELRPLLDALGDHGQSERATERDDRADQLPRVGVEAVDVDEVARDLERRHRESLEIAQRRVAGPEVVERDADPGVTQL